jgi:hypothetical protein
MIQRYWCKDAVFRIREHLTKATELLDYQKVTTEELHEAWSILIRCEHALLNVIDSELEDAKEVA